MTYALIQNDTVAKYPISLEQLRRIHPDLPEDFDLVNGTELGVVQVHDGAVPEVAEGQTLDEGLPVNVNGVWLKGWIVHDWLEVFEPAKLYARIEGETVHYPYTITDFRRDFPGTGTRKPPFTQMDGEWGIVPVEAVEPPEASPGQVAEPAGCELHEGAYRKAWVLRDRTPEELAEAKLSLRAAINQRRDAEMSAPVATPAGVVDADDSSIKKINGAVTMAILSQMSAQPFELVWTLADNSTVTLDAEAAIAMGMAVAQHVDACHQHARLLKEAADEAESFADLADIQIDAGWPE